MEVATALNVRGEVVQAALLVLLLMLLLLLLLPLLVLLHGNLLLEVNLPLPEVSVDLSGLCLHLLEFRCDILSLLLQRRALLLALREGLFQVFQLLGLGGFLPLQVVLVDPHILVVVMVVVSLLLHGAELGASTLKLLPRDLKVWSLFLGLKTIWPCHKNP